MRAKYDVPNGSKVIAKVKVDNRQTDKQTEQNQYAPVHSNQGITIVNNPPPSPNIATKDQQLSEVKRPKYLIT